MIGGAHAGPTDLRAAVDADVSEDEGESEEEENTGQWSPVPINSAHVGVSDDVVFEDDDARMLALLRAQVSPQPVTPQIVVPHMPCDHPAATPRSGPPV